LHESGRNVPIAIAHRKLALFRRSKIDAREQNVFRSVYIVKMPRFSNPLSDVKVASPCTADWDGMIGDERVRFCSQCELNVFNLSAITRAEAEHLIAGAESRLCVRFYRRRDGSIITQDCPVGLRALKLRASRIRKALAAALFGFFAGTSGTLAVRGVESALTDSLNWDSGPVMGTLAEPDKPPPVDVEVGRLEIKQPQRGIQSKRRRR
jgi:hypothetical protein